MIEENDRVSLPRWVRMRFDSVRNRHVLLAPERVLFPCPTSAAIIEEMGDGCSFGALVDTLAAKFEAPHTVIAGDVASMLAGLADQGFLVVKLGTRE